MEYNKLVCNFKDCYKELKESAYVTICSHIFCVDHGNKLKTNLSSGCLTCKEVLSEHQVMETNLNVNSKKILLSGFDPRTIIEIANSALSFWNYQKKHEYLNMKRTLDHYRLKLQNQTKIGEELGKEKDSQIKILQLEIEKLKSEGQSLKAEMASKTEEVLRAKRLKTDDDFFGI